MTAIILTIHLLLAIALVVVILLQRSEGGALGIGGSAQGMAGGRARPNPLTRATAILAACFVGTSLTLAIIASSERAPRSIVDDIPTMPTAPAQPAPPLGR